MTLIATNSNANVVKSSVDLHIKFKHIALKRNGLDRLLCYKMRSPHELHIKLTYSPQRLTLIIERVTLAFVAVAGGSLCPT